MNLDWNLQFDIERELGIEKDLKDYEVIQKFED